MADDRPEPVPCSYVRESRVKVRGRSQSRTLASTPDSGPQQSAARVSDATAPQWPDLSA